MKGLRQFVTCHGVKPSPIALGKFYSREEALSIGLLNKLVTPENAIPASLEKARQLEDVLPPFQRLKERRVKAELDRLENLNESYEEFVDQWFRPQTQEKIKTAVAKLEKN